MWRTGSCSGSLLIKTAPAWISTRELSVGIADARFAASLDRVTNKVSDCLTSLSALRESNSSWVASIEALENIARSPRRSLFRPQLVFLGSLLGLELQGKEPWSQYSKMNELEEFAAGIELQHLYMLIHDDVMDHGTIRRGVPTVPIAISQIGVIRSSQAGRETADHLAILVGDAVNAASLRLMINASARLDRGIAMDMVMNGALHAGAAQFEDVLGWQGIENRLSLGERLEDIQKSHAHDIASFHGFTVPLIAGLRLTSPSSHVEGELESHVRKFGELIGSAFYEVSDVADLVCDSSETGKDALQDLREGRLSQPLFVLRSVSDQEEWEDVAQILTAGSSGPMSLFNRRRVLSLMSKYQVVGKCVESSEAKLVEAQQVAQSLSASAPEFVDGCQKFVDGLRTEVSRVAQARGGGMY